MRLRALHTRGVLDIGHSTDDEPYLVRALRPGEVIALDDKYRVLQNIESAINAGYLEVLSYDSSNTSDPTQPELNAKAATTSLAPVALSGDYEDLTNRPTSGVGVSDAPYDATSWDGNTDAASKNVLRDKIESLDAAKLNTTQLSNATYNGATWNDDLNAATKNVLRDQFEYIKSIKFDASKVSDEAYSADTWNGSTDVPTKNAVRDQIELLSANKLDASRVSDIAYDATTWDSNTDVPTKNAIRDKIESLASGGFSPDFIQYNISAGAPSYSAGRMFYDPQEHTMAFMTDISTSVMQIGTESWIRVRNAGSEIGDGTVVRFTGETSGDRPLITPAQADTESNAEAIGVATHTIGQNEEGWVTTFGVVRDIDTSGPGEEEWSDGDMVWLSPTTAGGLSNVVPDCPNYAVPMGRVVYAHGTQGKLLVTTPNTAILQRLTVNCLSVHNAFCLDGTDELTISSGAVTMTGALHTIDGEGDADDYLATINGGHEGMLMLIKPESSERTIWLDSGAGNIITPTGSDYRLPDNAWTGLIYDGSNWTLFSQPEAIYWDDLKAPALSGKAGSSPPGFIQFKDNGSGSTGVFGYAFDDSSEEELFMAVQVPHNWKIGTNLEMHLHWVPSANGNADEVVNWGVEYTLQDIGEVFGNTTIVSSKQANKKFSKFDVVIFMDTNDPNAIFIGSTPTKEILIFNRDMQRIFQE